MSKSIRKPQLMHLARKALLRHVTVPLKPETRLVVDVIVQAIADMTAKKSTHLNKANKNDAIRFFGEPGRLDTICDLVGLNPAFARFVAERVKAA